MEEEIGKGIEEIGELESERGKKEREEEKGSVGGMRWELQVGLRKEEKGHLCQIFRFLFIFSFWIYTIAPFFLLGLDWLTTLTNQSHLNFFFF